MPGLGMRSLNFAKQKTTEDASALPATSGINMYRMTLCLQLLSEVKIMKLTALGKFWTSRLEGKGLRLELDESRRLKRIRSEAGDITLSQVYLELIY